MTEEELQKLLGEILDELSREGELEYIERKVSDYRNFGEYLSALSNGACLRNKDFGYLIFGVTDNNEIIGTNVTRGNLERAGIRSQITPKINYSCHSFAYKTSQMILVIIPAAVKEPTLWNGKAYVRIGEDKTALNNLTTDQIKKIYNSGTDWSAQIVERATVDDLDEAALAKAREKFKERVENARYAKEFDNWDTKTFLNKADLTLHGGITNAALLLLGKRESRHLLKNSSASEITWELKTKEESAYERFYPPFILSTTEVWRRIRNTKLKLFPSHELLAKEVSKYDEDVILEALHNCIAHQDYFSNDRGIIVTEEADKLTFISIGNFFEGRAEDYVIGNKDKAQNYRNHFLVSGMVNLGMIDKMGYGIKSMFKAQRRKYFPMPDYNKSTLDKVVLQIYGNVIDEKFSKILMEQTELDDRCVILLDHIQKGIQPSEDAAKLLKRHKLIEGRKGRYFIAAEIAVKTDKIVEYIHDKGQNNDYYKKLILDHLRIRDATKVDITRLIGPKLPDSLMSEQKAYRINNLIQSLRMAGRIKNLGSDRAPIWRLVT